MDKKIGYGFIFYSGIGNTVNIFSKRPKGVILAYHRVSPLSTVNALLRDLCVDPLSFDKQMVYLKKNYNVISLEQALEYANSASNKLDNSIVITFDDAYADNYEYAYPILKKHGLAATVFVSTSFIGSKRVFWWDMLVDMLKCTQKETVNFSFLGRDYKFKLNKEKQRAFYVIANLFKRAAPEEQETLTRILRGAFALDEKVVLTRCLSWEQIREMSKYNITFGSHTHSHIALSLVLNGQLQEELIKSKEILELNIKQRVTAFAYPFGEQGDFNKKSVALVAQTGYRCALTMLQGPVYCGDNAFTLRRVGVGGNDTVSIFKLKAMGLVPLFK